MKKILLSASLFAVLLVSCRKEHELSPKTKNVCLLQDMDPAGRSYDCNSIFAFVYTKNHCGLIRSGAGSYWIYEDSVFSGGVFSHTKRDTLTYTTYITVTDSLVWWKPSKEVGLPELFYANDSAIYLLAYRVFSQECIKDVKKEYSLYQGDSLRYLTSFEDNAAMGRSLKMHDPIQTACGSFDECIYYEKFAPFFRKDQVIIKPGIGVIKYRSEKAEMGMPQLKMDIISTLVAYHIE